MFNLPVFRQIKENVRLAHFAKTYEACSGLPVPLSYLSSNSAQVFGIFHDGKLISGFVLNHGPDYRTINVFAKAAARSQLYQRFSQNNCTEICCFFIAPDYRLKSSFNFLIWSTMIYAQKRYGREILLFGTCSRSLAKLYAQTKKTRLLHEDQINGKATFIFWGERRNCLGGMLKIMSHKLLRVLKILKRSTGKLSAPRTIVELDR